MHRWRNCPGSVKLARSVPKDINLSSVYAEEGTEAHALAKEILEARKSGTLEPDTIEKDPEMVDMVDLYVQHLNELGKKEPDAIQLFEHRFDLGVLWPGCFGTADGVTYYPQEKLLVVTDLKYGAGILVDVVRSDQLMYYALGAVLSLQWDVHKVRLEIVQPRTWVGDPVSSWETDIFELYEFADELVAAARATAEDALRLKVGGWCRFCPAAAANQCPLLREKAKEIASAEYVNYDIEPVDYAEIGRLLAWFPVLKSWMSAVDQFAYAAAMRGVKIPGRKLVTKYGRSSWRNAAVAVDNLTALGFSAAELMTEPVVPELLSPAKVKALKVRGRGVTKAELETTVARLSHSVSGGYALVGEDDDRPVVREITFETAFGSAVDDPLA